MNNFLSSVVKIVYLGNYHKYVTMVFFLFVLIFTLFIGSYTGALKEGLEGGAPTTQPSVPSTTKPSVPSTTPPSSS